MSARRAGFTLVELMVVIVLGGLVLAAGVHALIVQQRSYRQHRAVVAAQQTNRISLSVLTAELREMSAVGGDLLMAEPDSLEFRAYRKLGFVCSTDVPGQRLDVWVLGAAFEQGDSIWAFAEGVTGTASDDEWRVMRVGNISSPSCTGDWESMPLTRLNLPDDAAKLSGIEPGAPIRSFESMTYGLFQVDGEWVLGRHGVGDPVEVLIGPLLSPEEDGLEFTYYDDAGNDLAAAGLNDPAVRESVARIGITVRGRSPAPGANGGEFYTDSLTTELFLRNH